MNDKYLQYQLNDFLEDPEFISEILEGHPNKESWSTWLVTHPALEKSYLEATSLISTIQFRKNTLSKNQIDQIWNKIDNNTPVQPVLRRRWIRGISYSGIAASILLLIYFTTGLFQNKTITAVRSERISYELPDQSSVTLNAASIVQFNEAKWEKKRSIKLSGEAFFNVRKGKDFIVVSPHGQVRVLGTSFNVFSRDSLFEVKCKTGSVMVIPSSKDTIILASGDAITYKPSNGKITEFKTELESISSWTKGIFMFKNSDLEYIFKEMERQFDIIVQFEKDTEIKNRKFTGAIKTDDLDKALKDICWPLRLSYTIEGKIVKIGTQLQ